ncbi:MAG: preprotein translocase subunit SecE [Thermodesulfobacteriota bacterium]
MPKKKDNSDRPPGQEAEARSGGDKAMTERTKNTPAPARKPANKKGPAREEEKGPGFIVRTRQFFREVKIELKKVTWPSRKETMASTSVILVLVFIIALYLGLVDFGLSWALGLLIR